ncbi:MBL fold metallo-hydrolase [Oribacterium sp. C9]|nr:MBL fold metallo-hydrolase [Oribacterium sp. C9]
MKVHQIKIDFNVTEQIKRFVYVYILEAESLYLIDSGVYGSETKIMDYLDSIGRNTSEIKGVFLTHAHPDHIGSAAWFREHSGCKIYASEGERLWIEDIDLQFKERPIPNFYNLAGKSSKVDFVV